MPDPIEMSRERLEAETEPCRHVLYGLTVKACVWCETDRCDYSECHTTGTVGRVGKWRFCPEHMKREHHPPRTHLVLDPQLNASTVRDEVPNG